MPMFEKLVVVTQTTALEELVKRYNTRAQARFYLEHLGSSFDSYQAAHDAYHTAREQLRATIPEGLRSQWVERSFLPNFLFGPHDLVVALGRDGLVVNTAKYLNGQPLVGVNPDPERIDGVLLPFHLPALSRRLKALLLGEFDVNPITMAKATLNTGPTLYAVNDLFVGQRTHVSARYRLEHAGKAEEQSSSGIIVSTGAGSTGWLRSVLAGAAGIIEGFLGDSETDALRKLYRFPWDAAMLQFSVREPFASKTSSAEIVFGRVRAGENLVVVSRMPQGGVIFSDGIEADYLEFNSGAVATINVADKSVHLVVA